MRETVVEHLAANPEAMELPALVEGVSTDDYLRCVSYMCVCLVRPRCRASRGRDGSATILRRPAPFALAH
jgi:hypothetical protein